MTDDRDLRARFQRARHDEASHVPPFEQVVSGRAPSAMRRVGWLVPAGVLAAAALVVLMVRAIVPHDPAPRIVIEVEPGQLRTPTDFLLDLAGTRIAGSIPELGVDTWDVLPPGVPEARDTGKGAT